jgi:surfactin synthase thioesterase subunit
MRLICFSYGGGGPSAFQTWGDLLPASIEVCAVQLPGREDRADEQPVDDPAELTAALAKALEPLLDKPLAFYGHCIGADAAFQLIRADRRFVPVHFFAGASLPPHAPTFAQRFAKAHSMTESFDPRRVPESVAHDYMRSIGYPEALFEDAAMLAKVMPSIWAELALQLEQRTLVDGERIACPITVFAGDRDSLCNADELREWDRYTSAPFRFEKLSGGHLFLFDDREELLRAIARDLGAMTAC